MVAVILGILAILAGLITGLAALLRRSTGIKVLLIAIGVVAVIGGALLIFIPETGSTSSIPPKSSLSASSPPALAKTHPAVDAVWTKPCANLRSSASANSRLLTCVPYGTVLVIHCVRHGHREYAHGYKSNLWDFVAWHGKAGFMSDVEIYTGKSSAAGPPCR